MTDLSTTIEPKSDQLNADDLVSGPRTIRITGVSGTSNKDQPIAISFEGDNNRPFYPCKSMRRVLVHLWGKDGSGYVGRELTLFRDPKVTFGGIEVGGIRISHMSHIDADQSITLTTTRAKRAPYKVRKLVPKQPAPEKQKGDIKQARTMIEGAYADSVEPILAGLREQSWTADEKKELAALASAAKSRQRETAEGEF